MPNRPRFSLRSIRTRVTLLFVAVTTLVMAGFGAVNYATLKTSLESRLAADGEALAARLRMNLPGPLWNLDAKQIDRVLEAEMMSPDITANVIRNGATPVAGRSRDPGGKPVPTTAQTPGLADPAKVDLVFDNDGKASPVGEAEVQTSTARLDHALRAALWNVTLQTLVLNLVMVGAMTAALHLQIFKPLAGISGALERIAGGESNLHVELEVAGDNELSRIAAAFNGFIAKLRHTFDEVQVAATHVEQGASEIASGNEDLSVRTERQAARLQEVAASMTTLTDGVRRNAQLAGQLAGLTDSAAGAAHRSAEVMGQATSAMDRLTESSRRISDITSVIDSIAFQTNILALNAAVEAARAGEQGRGFAVVAAEVRTLAQRCATAAKEISELIGDSVTQVESGGQLIRETGVSVDTLVGVVEQVTGHIQEISQACQAQSRDIGVAEVSIREIDHMTSQNTALIEQTSAASNSLKEEAQSLGARMQQFA